MTEQVLLTDNNPIVQAWNKYKETDEYKNILKWCSVEQHKEGSLWAAFCEGYSQCLVDRNRGGVGGERAKASE